MATTLDGKSDEQKGGRGKKVGYRRWRWRPGIVGCVKEMAVLWA